MNSKLPLYLALLTLTQCSKCKTDDPEPLAQLPPITQEGKNTFGCLINGQPYTPAGFNGTENSVCLYEPGPPSGNLSIQTYRYSDNGGRTSITINIFYVVGAGTYRLDLPAAEGRATFRDRDKPYPCNDFGPGNTVNYRNGHLTLTRVDEQAGIIAGTFAFTLARPGCDTIRVTDGRFDATF